jgi:hypothetical protein
MPMNKLLFFLGVRRFTVLIRMDIYKHSCSPIQTSPLWPANIPTFEKILRKFESACLDLTLRVFDVISVVLDGEQKNNIINLKQEI